MAVSIERGWNGNGLLAVLLAGLLFHVAPVWSADVDGLFAAEVDVPAQTDDARDVGMREALAAVLLKLTGDRAIATHPELASLLAQAPKIVEQYRFRELPPEGDGLAPPVRLWALFDANAVMAALQKSGVPVWGRSRPTVLFWAVIEEAGARTVFDPGMRQDGRNAVETRADLRGVPMVLPLWDLDDQRALAPADLWGNFSETIQRASARYRTNATLVGRIYKRVGSDWTARWTLYDVSGRFDWETSAATIEEALATGIDGTADNMTRRYAQIMSPSSSEQLSFVVSGVDSIARYGRVMQYLESLDAVARVRVTSLEEMTLTLALQLRGTRDGLANMIALSDVMVPQENSLLPLPGSAPMAPNALYYRMLP